MPIFDVRCRCGWERDDVFEHVNQPSVCGACGEVTEHVWKERALFAVHGDDAFIGGKTFENLGHEPVTVYSRAELNREMAARGLRPMVRHVGEPGSDKSKHSSRWV
jgi:hypothetical protein